MKNRKTIESGQAMLLATIFFLFITLTIIFGITIPVINHIKLVTLSNNSKQSFILAETGTEDIIYRLKNNKQVPSSLTLLLNGGTSTITTSNTLNGKSILAVGNSNNIIRKSQSDVSLGTGVSFHYGVQVGDGGISMNQGASVTGNIFSSGPVFGLNYPHNVVAGDVVSSGSGGLIYGVYATGSMYAHTIGKSSFSNTTLKDAYYETILNTTVSGSNSCTNNSHCHPGSADQGLVDLPISDDQIDQWESDAAAGGTLASSACDSFSSNTCTVTSARNWGPIKIPFNLILKNTAAVLTVSGPIWVTGSLDLQSGPTVKMNPSLGSQNVAIIADNPSDQITSSDINIGQSSIFQGSGAANSFVFMISQNSNLTNGCSANPPAIIMGQSSSALVAYASHGIITFSQSASSKEATAYQICMTQSANITYDTGLPNTIFEAGPGGGYNILDWGEVQ
jgi:hypothetical protein